MSNLSSNYSDNVISLVDDCIEKHTTYNRLFRELSSVSIENLSRQEVDEICQLMIEENKSLVEDSIYSNQYHDCVLPIFQQMLVSPTDSDLMNMYIDESKSCAIEWTKSELKCLIDERMQRYCDLFFASGEAA